MTDINMQSANPAFLHDPSNLLNAPKQRKSKEKSCERHRRMKQRCPVECPDRPEKLVKQFVPPTLAPIMSMKVAPPQFAVAVPFQVPMVDSKVKCSNAGLGCLWEGSNADLHTHLGKCDYQMFPCRWKCHGVYTRKDLMGHEEICDLKLPLCMKCSSPVKIGDLEKHETECPMVTVECPKKCGVSILRGRESAHATDCPLQLTRCLHNDRGCNVQLLRKDMKDHLKECSYETFKSLFSRIDALEQKVAQQFDKIQEQNLRIIQLDLKVGQQERTIKSQQEVIAKLKEPTSSDSPVAMQPDEGKIELVDPYVNNLKRNHEKPKKGPKKTQSAYMFFCSEKRKEISAKNPYMKMVDVVKELSKMWNECSDRKKYEEMAAKDKERYEKEKMMMNAGQDVMSEEDSASSSSDSLIFEENEEVERSPKRSNVAN